MEAKKEEVKTEVKQKGINWIVRKNNMVFVANVAMAVVVPVLAYFGLTVKDMTTWGAVGQVIVDAAMNPYVVAMIAVGIFNAINDPTTKGIGDSEAALNRTVPSETPKK